MDHRPRPEPVQPLQPLRNPDHPAHPHLPSNLRVRARVGEHGADGAAAGEFEDEGEADLGDLQHAEELDQVRVVEPEAKLRFLENLRKKLSE